eukprot:2787651-Ditylum_brightwellii.AAC.1
MEEVDGRSRMLEKSPPMTEPLVDLLGYSGITEKADGIDEYTQLYLEQLRAVDGCLPQPAEPVPFP